MAVDLNLTYGTVTDGGGSMWTVASPEYANDGITDTKAAHLYGVKGSGTWDVILKTDLGAPRIVTTCRTYGEFSHHGWTALEYSDDGSGWSLATDVWEVVGFHWNAYLEEPVTARYWRIRRTWTLTGLTFISSTQVNFWELWGETPPEPPAGIYADWDNDGFGDAASDDCLTNDVASWRIVRGASSEITGGTQPGTATIVLNNRADDRYNPRNPAGPLYGLLRDGVPIWIGVGQDGSVAGPGRIGLFGGRITDITPIPVNGADVCPTVEILAVDCLGWYERTPVAVAQQLNRTHGQLRADLLAAGGETRVQLPTENTSLTLSGADGTLLAELEELNRANGSRHYCKPGARPEDWYTYVAVNRLHNTDGIADFALNDATGAEAERGITGSDGWRYGVDTVVNQQRVAVTPVQFTLGAVIVWQASELPLRVTSSSPRDLWVEFDDTVRDPVVTANWTGSTPTLTLTPAGASAKLHITSAGTTTITRLEIEGRLARRGQAEVYVANDAASQAPPRGVRAGSDIEGDRVGVIANARALASHIVWRYGQPQYRPSVVVEDWMPNQALVQLFDLVDATVDQMGAGSTLFEVVGIQHARDQGPVVTTLVLQESRVQTPTSWFRLGVSLLNGPDKLAY